MKPSPRFLALLGLLPLVLAGQEHAPDSGLADVPPVLPADFEVFAARPGEERLADKLKGIRVVASMAQLADPGFPAPGLDATRVPLINDAGLPYAVVGFLDQPVSQQSLNRLVTAIRFQARAKGHTFLSVYLPPQDITDGFVQVVVSEATVDGPVAVRGARYFSEEDYRAALRQRPGEPVDQAVLEEDIAWLNRNPNRQVRAAAEAGAEPGTTRLVLQVEERRPWNLTASYDNTGTVSTSEDRVGLGVNWANALWRGDRMGYRFNADPELEHSKAHSLYYLAYLPWRHIATLSAAYSDLASIMPEPFTQRGTTWQVSGRYEVPLRPLSDDLKQTLSFTADFKYSDNNIEFALLPVTNNVTHVLQFGASYGLTFGALGGLNAITANAYLSPGDITHYNTDAAFDGTRPGAEAQYAYCALTFSHQRRVAGGLSWSTSGTFQASSGALLGSEQLNGGGSGAVRGYPESSAFGDWGVVVNNELHAPAFSLFKNRDSVDLFAFVDLASLNLHVEDESTDLRSAGLGLNYSFGSHFTLRAAYGWHPDNSNGPFVLHSGHGHISAGFQF